MAPLPCSDTGLFLPHIIQASTWGVVALYSLFLYSDMPPSPFLLSNGSGNFEPNQYLYKYPNNLVPVILTAYTNCEHGTECSETSAYKIRTPGNCPKERIQHSEHDESLKSRNVCSYWYCHWDPVALNDSRMLNCKGYGKKWFWLKLLAQNLSRGIEVKPERHQDNWCHNWENNFLRIIKKYYHLISLAWSICQTA
jgi:hypothetical protein